MVFDSEEIVDLSLLSSEDTTDARVAVVFRGDASPGLQDKSAEFIRMLGEVRIPVILGLTSRNDAVPLPIVEAFDLCYVCESAKVAAGAEVMTAEAAESRGFVNAVFTRNALRTEVLEVADRIASLAPLAVRSCKQAVRRGMGLAFADGLELESRLFSRLFASEDMREGTRAFLEKREPRFRGS